MIDTHTATTAAAALGIITVVAFIAGSLLGLASGHGISQGVPAAIIATSVALLIKHRPTDYPEPVKHTPAPHRDPLDVAIPDVPDPLPPQPEPVTSLDEFPVRATASVRLAFMPAPLQFPEKD